jgi:hypothetical protein
MTPAANKMTLPGILCSGNMFTELLPSNDGWGIHIQTQRLMEGCMKCVVVMGVSVVIYVPIFIKIGSDIEKSISGINIQICRQQVDLICISLFFSK